MAARLIKKKERKKGYRISKTEEMTAVGFEPTPFRTRA